MLSTDALIVLFAGAFWSLGMMKHKVLAWNLCQYCCVGQGSVHLPHSKKLHNARFMSSSKTETYEYPIIQRNEVTGALEVNTSSFNPFKIDFLSGASKKRISKAREELVCKALGKANIVIDMTGGLGRDGLILAASGKRVLVFERHPTIYQLLQDALQRLNNENKQLADRISLVNADCIQLPNMLESIEKEYGLNLKNPQQIVSCYIDVMYSEKFDQRKSKSKKDTQILQMLTASSITPEEETKEHAAIFEVAKQFSADRIVVKRSLGCPYFIDSIEPHSQLKGSKQRFDIYFANRFTRPGKQ